MATLHTRRLTLRPPQDTDRAALVHSLDNPNVSRWTGRIPWPYRQDDAEAFLAHARGAPGDSLILLITYEEAGIGGIGIEAGELGYWLAEPQWRRGFGAEAAQAVVDHGFAAERREQIRASYFDGNAASRRILEGLGFEATGEAISYSRARQAEVRMTELLLTWEAWKNAKERQR
ncbi:GNAT family N-acetyltransferase [Aestuariivirga sp.]|uniref:GNAT family N-acetyltransferase n=1 Tax=Aestuariivirga sp. TaxID=2650926 RepID=UPI00391CC167